MDGLRPPGNYTCACRPGYKLVDSRFCEGMWVFLASVTPILDIDECANPVLNNCDPAFAKCINSDGNYTCECRSGYQLEGTNCRGRRNHVMNCLNSEILMNARWGHISVNKDASMDSSLLVTTRVDVIQATY